MIEKEIKRGYVKWEDIDGVMHKELLTDHPELLAKATPMQQLAAEEARRMAEAGEAEVKNDEEEGEQIVLDTLGMLKAAPEDILTGPEAVNAVSAAEADPESVEGTKPMSGAEENHLSDEQTKILEELRTKD